MMRQHLAVHCATRLIRDEGGRENSDLFRGLFQILAGVPCSVKQKYVELFHQRISRRNQTTDNTLYVFGAEPNVIPQLPIQAAEVWSLERRPFYVDKLQLSFR